MNSRYLIGLVAAAAVGAAATLPAQTSPDDSSFVLSSDDPGRTPSPFVGNGRLGVVVPALGIGAANAFLAGLYEEAEGDVPRIAAIPSWTGVGVFDGERWLDSTSAGGSLRSYQQVLDMRTGTARTSYDWARGDRVTSVSVESFVSRADPHLAVLRLELTPRQEERLRVRFAIAGRPPPRRIPLARLERSDPAWKPADIWYPGHMRVHSRQAARERIGRTYFGELDAGGTQDDARPGGGGLLGRGPAPRRGAHSGGR